MKNFREGTDINVGIGYVNEKTIPKELLLECHQQVVANPDVYKVALNYGGSRGSENLIRSLGEFLIKYGGLSKQTLSANELVIGSNGASSILDAISDLFEPGTVITSDPMYYIYTNALERKGYDLLTVPEDELGIQPEKLAKAIEGMDTSKLRFIYLVTVSNPTSTLLPDSRRREVVKLAEELSQKLGRKIPVILDKAYEGIIHDPGLACPASSLEYNNLGLVYEIGTLSKIIAPALRAAYIIGKSGSLLDAICQKNSDVGFSAPLINQEMASYFLDHYIEEQLTKVNAGYREKALKTKKWIDHYLGDYLEGYTGGQAGFYFYLTFKTIDTTEKGVFCRYLTRNTGDKSIDGSPDKKPMALYLPGEFCVNPNGSMYEKAKRQLRLSYGFEELDKIETALQYMKEAAEYVT